MSGLKIKSIEEMDRLFKRAESMVSDIINRNEMRGVTISPGRIKDVVCELRTRLLNDRPIPVDNTIGKWLLDSSIPHNEDTYKLSIKRLLAANGFKTYAQYGPVVKHSDTFPFPETATFGEEQYKWAKYCLPKLKEDYPFEWHEPLDPIGYKMGHYNDSDTTKVPVFMKDKPNHPEVGDVFYSKAYDRVVVVCVARDSVYIDNYNVICQIVPCDTTDNKCTLPWSVPLDKWQTSFIHENDLLVKLHLTDNSVLELVPSIVESDAIELIVKFPMAKVIYTDTTATVDIVIYPKDKSNLGIAKFEIGELPQMDGGQLLEDILGFDIYSIILENIDLKINEIDVVSQFDNQTTK